MSIGEPHVLQWTRDDYYRMAEAGLFAGRRVELIAGQVIEMSPIGRRHVITVIRATDALRRVFGDGWHLQIQAPLKFGNLSEPEPDIAVIAGDPEDYPDHPSTAVLIVEVADTSLNYDRTEKASLYAAAGIPDYWILNLIDYQLEVHRNAVEMPEQPHGFGYAGVTILAEEDPVQPLAVPGVIQVADLLP